MAEDGRPGQAEALGAAREGFELVQGGGAEGGEAEGGQGELGALQAQGGQGQQATQHQAHQGGGQQRGHHAQAQLGDHEACGVGAQAQEGHVGEVHLPEVAHGDVQANEEDAVDGQQREQAQGVGIHHQQRDRGEEGEDDELGTAEEEDAFHLTPS